MVSTRTEACTHSLRERGPRKVGYRGLLASPSLELPEGLGHLNSELRRLGPGGLQAQGALQGQDTLSLPTCLGLGPASPLASALSELPQEEWLGERGTPQEATDPARLEEDRSPPNWDAGSPIHSPEHNHLAACPQVYLLRPLGAEDLQGEVPVVCLWVGDAEVGRGRRGTQGQGVALEEGCRERVGRPGQRRPDAHQSLGWTRLPVPVVQLSEVLKLRKGEPAVTQATTEVLSAITVWKGGQAGSVPSLHLTFTADTRGYSLWLPLAWGSPGPSPPGQGPSLSPLPPCSPRPADRDPLPPGQASCFSIGTYASPMPCQAHSVAKKAIPTQSPWQSGHRKA